MNIKEIFKFWVCFLCLSLIFFCKADLAMGSSRIVINNPLSEIAFTENLSVEGSLLNSKENYVRIKVEPFIEKKDYKTSNIIVPVNNGKFKKSVLLPQGISIITVSTLDNRINASKVILFFSSAKGLKEENWGKESPIKFYEPAELRVVRSNVGIKGGVFDSSLKNIEVVVINLSEFQRLVSNKDALSGLAYKNVRIENSKFSFSQSLNPGINLAIARPEGKNAAQLTQTKIIIYEELNPKINLFEPKITNKKLIIEGFVNNISSGQVTVRVEALVRKDENLMPTLNVILEKTTNLNKNKKFRLDVDLEETKGIFDSSYFLISVFSGNERTVRLIIK